MRSRSWTLASAGARPADRGAVEGVLPPRVLELGLPAVLAGGGDGPYGAGRVVRARALISSE